MTGPAIDAFSRRSFLISSGALLILRAARLRAYPSLPSLTPPCLLTAQSAYPPMLAKFINRLDPGADVFPAESHVAEIQKILDTWTVALTQSPRNDGGIRNRLSTHVQASSFAPAQTVPLRAGGVLSIDKRIFSAPQPHTREQFGSSLAAWLAGFASLETVELQIYGSRIQSESPLTLETDLRSDLVGSTHERTREQRVGAWHLTWVRDEQQDWKIQRWAIDPETRSRLSGPGFTEITGHCIAPDSAGMAQLLPGIDDWRTALDGASGIDVYGNHGIAVGDIENSGCDSFYVCQPSGLPNRLYRNRGDGTFEDITEASGTGILDGTASAIFADFQNRGQQDLLVVRTGGPLLFVNQGNGRFKPEPDAFQFARAPQGTFTSAAVADYNLDGFLDVYFCVYSYYQGLNQYAYPSPYYDAQNGPPNFMFRNRGDGTFVDVTAASGMDQNNNRFSFAAAWCDYDNNGWPDLYVANDFGRKNLYHSNGDGTFNDVAAEASVEDYGPGMSTCWLDPDNDGLQDLYVANMWLPEGKRITADENFLPGVDPAIRALYRKHNAGNSLYRNTGKSSFENRTEAAGTSMGRWSWSCASWDFDHDGWSDLYVANGFVSGPNRHDLQSFFWRQVAQRSMSPQGATPDYELAWNAVNELIRADYSWSGYQRNVFFANNQDGTFSDVSGVLGLDLIDDSRAYALSDFDHDGRMELVLKNRSSPQLRLLRNNLTVIGDSITFRLTGTVSNRDAIGTVITIESGAPRQTKFLSAGSGFASQHTKELAFGLGASTQAVSISLRWPNGSIAHYKDVPPNHRIEIVEGQQTFQATAYLPTRRQDSAAPAAPPSPATVSTWLIAPLFGPELDLPDLEGEHRKLSTLQGKPVVLVFVRAGCEGSSAQLVQLQTQSQVLRQVGIALYVVAVSPGTEDNAVRQLVRSAGVRFPVHLADEQAAGAWNIQYRYLFDRRRDLAMPTAFLLDKTGAIIRLYQGEVSPRTVVEDWQSAPANEADRFKRAMPFAGPYYGGPLKHDYLTYGIAFAEYGYVDEAQAAFLRVIENDPTHESAWFNLGTIYLNKKMLPEARKYLTEATRLNPQDSDAWNNLGMISGQEQKYDEALDQFRHAALANPDHLLAVENLMRIYRFQGRAADAQKTLQELLAHAPENADLHLALAMALIAQNDLQPARMELETSIRLRPKNPDAINNLGTLLLRLGRPDEALNRFETVRQMAPDFDRATINASLVYQSQGQSAKARAILREFLAHHPENDEVRGALEKMGPP